MTNSTTDTRVITVAPPVRQGARARNLWFGLGAIALLLLGVGLFMRAHAKSATASPPTAAGPGGKPDRKPRVAAVTVQPKPFPVMLEGLGTVTPLATVTVKTQVDGRLMSLSFQEGGMVKRGQVLAQIDPRPFQIMLEQAKATLARDRAQQHNAQLDLARYTTLEQQRLISQQQLDAQHALVDQLAGSVAMDEAAVDNAALQLDYSRITSPVDGVAGIRQVDPGNLLHATDATGIVVLTKLDPIAVIFTVPQDELPRLAAASEGGPRTVVAFNRDGDEELGRGKLTVIDNQINAATGTVRLKAEFPNPKNALWPQQFVRARLQVTTEQNALTLPAAAIQH
ncbi:MAG TPA: efflux RND transporter periplasmic adaptor subunit, partial [Polyangiales bacterium]